MLGFLKKAWDKINEPSLYDLWNSAFQKLQDEKKAHGISAEYWRIWYDEVCPTYRKMTEANRKIGVGFGSLTSQLLEDMDKPINQRTHF